MLSNNVTKNSNQQEKITTNIIYNQSDTTSIEFPESHSKPEIFSTITQEINKGRHLIMRAPSGWGKTDVYQHITRILDKTTVVVLPLLSLINDQYERAVKNNFDALVFKNEKSLRGHEKELIYCTPERFLKLNEILKQEYHEYLIIIDEAHCVSTWGHDFRPAYRNIFNIISTDTCSRMIGLSATLNPNIMGDLGKLWLKPLSYISLPINRSNIHIHRIYSPSFISRLENMLHIASQHKDKGLVFCSTRNQAVYLSDFLNNAGFQAQTYHAGLSAKERGRIEKSYRENNEGILVCTTAYSMGVHVPNISWIIHFSPSESISQYYQEIGRAGRNNNQAFAYIFWDENEFQETKTLLLQNKQLNKAKHRIFKKLNTTKGYKLNQLAINGNTSFAATKNILLEFMNKNLIINKKDQYIIKNNNINWTDQNDILQIQKIIELDTLYKFCAGRRDPWDFLHEYYNNVTFDSENETFENNANKKFTLLHNSDGLSAVSDTKLFNYISKAFIEHYQPHIPKSKYHGGGTAIGIYKIGTWGKCVYESKYKTNRYPLHEIIPRLLPYLMNNGLRYDYLAAPPSFTRTTAFEILIEKLSIISKIPLLDKWYRLRPNQKRKSKRSKIEIFLDNSAMFTADWNSSDFLAGKNILLFDDLYRTGITMNSAAKLFKQHKAQNIDVIVLAVCFGRLPEVNQTNEHII